MWRHHHDEVTDRRLAPAIRELVHDQPVVDVLLFVVGTDPTLTMSTRRGTGYYKIPSLKGV